MMLQNVIQTVMMTNNFEENLDTGLKVNAITWSMAAAMHVPAMMNKTQPKELCLQQLVVIQRLEGKASLKLLKNPLKMQGNCLGCLKYDHLP